MDKLVIEGGSRLKGDVAIGGAKNAALPVMAAALLADGVSTIERVPHLADIAAMGALLGDLGADVIKVERPGAGDDTRTWGPPWLQDEAGQDTSEAAYYLAANRNKRSITVDISTPEGQDIVRKLAAHADVVLENYKVGQLKKYGLDYDSLKAIKPDLVYCSITGFGQTGPYAARAGYDFIVQGMGGFMSLTGERDDLPGGGPQKAGVAISDLMTGMYATVAVLAALANPVSVEETRDPLDDVAIVVIDDSLSQGVGQRREATEVARAALESRLERLEDRKSVV